MDANAAFRPQVQVNLHGLVEIHVLHLHEPARQARSHRDERDIESAALGFRLPVGEVPPGIGEILAVTGVAAEKPMKVLSDGCPCAPQCFIAVVETSTRPMLRRREMKFEAGVNMLLPPIEFHPMLDSEPLQPRFDAYGC